MRDAGDWRGRTGFTCTLYATAVRGPFPYADKVGLNISCPRALNLRFPSDWPGARAGSFLFEGFQPQLDAARPGRPIEVFGVKALLLSSPWPITVPARFWLFL